MTGNNGLEKNMKMVMTYFEVLS